MGGNALSHCTGRFTRKEYDHVKGIVIDELYDLFGETRRISDIKFFESKDSFGDMDILMSSENLPNDWHKLVIHDFSSVDHYLNGGVLSFEYAGKQIDIILTKPEDYDIAYIYFSFNDLGNLMGRIAHKMGFKYGHDGLWYVLRDGDRVISNILVSKDARSIFEFLGYDFDRYLKGFDTLEEIFEYVVDNAYFSPEIYKFDNRNHHSRVRDRKRTSYMKFLAYCDTLPGEGGFYDWSLEKNSKAKYLDSAFDKDGYFPDFRDTYNARMAEYEVEKYRKSRFNGNVVSEITGLEGKELGRFMSFLRADPAFMKIVDGHWELGGFILSMFWRYSA